MVTYAAITDGGGGAGSVINQAGGDGLMSTLMSPVVLVGGAIAAYFVMR